MDWRILRDGGICLYWRREFLDEDIGWFSQQNYQVFSLECDLWDSDAAMHGAFQSKLSFPACYGKNFAALNDCLTDLPVPDDGGLVIVLSRFDTYARGHGAVELPSGRPGAEIVLDILAGAARFYLLTGRRFLSLVQSDDPRIEFQGLAPVTAIWNQREWLKKDRGL